MKKEMMQVEESILYLGDKNNFRISETKATQSKRKKAFLNFDGNYAIVKYKIEEKICFKR